MSPKMDVGSRKKGAKFWNPCLSDLVILFLGIYFQFTIMANKKKHLQGTFYEQNTQKSKEYFIIKPKRNKRSAPVNLQFGVSLITCKGDMSNTANNLPLVPGNWRSGNDSTIYAPSNYVRGSLSEAQAPGNYAWSRPYAAPRTLSYNQGFVREEDVRNSTNNRSAVTESRRSGSNSDSRLPNYNNFNRPPPAPRPHPSRQHEIGGGAQDPWRVFEDRVRTGPYGLEGFPLHPLSPMRIVVLGDEMAPEVNPRLRQFIQESPPRIRGQWNMQLAPGEEESSRLSREEQNRALQKLKKQVYNPYPKSRNKSWRLYYRDTSSFGKMEEEDEKSCAICLEDFVPRQEVLVTPCNHMFHESCIVRWVKSNGQCPVCRFVIGEQRRETPLPLNNNNTNLAANDLMAVDLIALIRAMEEAFEWVHVPQ